MAKKLTPAQIAARAAYASSQAAARQASAYAGAAAGEKPYVNPLLAPAPERAFTPWQAPTSAPAGSYDPVYDAQLDNANVGFGYQAEDYDTNKTRLSADYDQSKAYAATDHGYSLADLLTAKDRGVQDYGTATTRLGEDYATQTQGLQRNYTNLGSAQNQSARAAGVGGGGALAQAMMKRQANQAIDQSGIDRTRDRSSQDLNTNQSRFLADNSSSTDRENDRYGRQVAGLDTGYFRSGADLDTGYQRAAVTNDQFGRQINTQELYAAQQAGGLPTAPANEATNSKTGETYRSETHNGVIYHVYSNGRMVPIRKAT